MKIGERGQVTIPKEFRERLGLLPSMEVEFTLEGGRLVLRKASVPSRSRSATIKKWIGCLEGQPGDVDRFIEDIRGR